MGEQKKSLGRKLFGVFPAQYPREILWAMNILPVEIWDPPLEVSRANVHLQPYICPVVKRGLELILQGHGSELDGFLFPHTCDSIQNLASIVNDFLGLEKPCYFFYHPKAPYSDSSRRYYLGELKGLASSLEKRWGALDPSELRLAVEKGRELASLFEKIYTRRGKGELSASNRSFYRTIRQNEYLHPDDSIPLLEQFLRSSTTADISRKSTKVVMSGVLPHPLELLGLLDQLGVAVVDDDLISCGRRLLTPPAPPGDPFEALTDAYFRMPPCSTRTSSLQERLDHLLGKVERSGARAVVFCLVTFCEPELFDLPQVVQGLKERGIRSLVLETDLDQGLSGQMSTRVEGFVELLNEDIE